MRHDDIRITLDTYSHLRENDLLEAVNLVKKKDPEKISES